MDSSIFHGSNFVRMGARAILLASILSMGCEDKLHIQGETTSIPLMVKSVEPGRGVKTGLVPVRIYFQSSAFDGTGTVTADIGGSPVTVSSTGGPLNSFLWYADGVTSASSSVGFADVAIAADGAGQASLAGGFFVYPASQVLSSTDVAAPHPGPVAAFAEDMDLDGRHDAGLIFQGAFSDRICVLFNDPGPVFSRSTEISAGFPVVQACAADFSGDGKPDVLALCPSSQTAIMFPGNGAGGFGAAATFAVSATASSLAAADFNGDGKTDAVVIRPGSAGIYLNAGGGSFSMPATLSIGSGPAKCFAEDVNLDLLPDLLVSDGPEQSLSVLKGDSAAGLAARTMTLLPFQPFCGAAGKLNQDARPDAAIGCPGGAAVYLQNIDGTYSSVSVVPFSAPSAIGVRDFNGDGLNDFIATDGFALSARMGNGTGWVLPPLSLDLPFPTTLAGLCFGDFDCDDFIDVLTAEPAAGMVHFCFGK